MAAAEQETLQTTVVTILGTEYPVRSEADPDYVVEIATMVEEAMRSFSRDRSVESRADVAVMAAMNFADELSRTKERLQEALQQVADTTDALAKALDDVASAPDEPPSTG